MPTVLGYVAMIIAGSLLGAVRRFYLIQMSAKIDYRERTQSELRTAWWAYLAPLSALVFGGFLGCYALHQTTRVGFLLLAALSLFALFGTGVLFRSFAKSSVQISMDKIVYVQDGKCEQILASDVLWVKILWFSFLVGLRWQRQLRVPATFKSSEMILAFLREAVRQNKHS